MGNVLMLGTSGLIAASPIGWPSIFYISGGFGILWTILWFVFGSNSPEENKFISIEEKTYIQESLGQITDVEEIKVGKMHDFNSCEKCFTKFWTSFKKRSR